MTFLQQLKNEARSSEIEVSNAVSQYELRPEMNCVLYVKSGQVELVNAVISLRYALTPVSSSRTTSRSSWAWW